MGNSQGYEEIGLIVIHFSLRFDFRHEGFCGLTTLKKKKLRTNSS